MQNCQNSQNAINLFDDSVILAAFCGKQTKIQGGPKNWHCVLYVLIS